jgi:hypothetical protein
MKVRELLKFTDRNLPRDRFARVVDPAQVPNRIGTRHGPAVPQDIFPDADPTDGMVCGLPPAVDQSPTSLAPISTPNRPDLDFIKAQIVRLPRHTAQQTNLSAPAGVNSGASGSREL